MKVTILSGSGRYQDQWHDFTATSVEVARSLEALGLEVAVRAFKAQGVVQDVPDADLLVVNSGSGEYHESSDGPEAAWADAFQVLRDHRTRARPVLALHAASNTLDGLDEWPTWLGGPVGPGAVHAPADRTGAGGGERR